ncbi:diol dehydratase small subunit [Desulforhopalus sp. 52FAK]
MVQFSKEQIAEIMKGVGQEVSPQVLESAVRKVLSNLEGNGLNAATSPSNSGDKIDASSYPLGEKRKDLVRSATGKSLDDITLDKVVSGEIQFEDIKTRPETLSLQTQVADSVNRPRLADNLRRAGEMTQIPDERILEMYNFLRPYRATKQELLSMADELEGKYAAATCAKFVREAATVYEKSKRLKGDR